MMPDVVYMLAGWLVALSSVLAAGCLMSAWASGRLDRLQTLPTRDGRRDGRDERF